MNERCDQTVKRYVGSRELTKKEKINEQPSSSHVKIVNRGPYIGP
jgi:hypothetical protein